MEVPVDCSIILHEEKVLAEVLMLQAPQSSTEEAADPDSDVEIEVLTATTALPEPQESTDCRSCMNTISHHNLSGEVSWGNRFRRNQGNLSGMQDYYTRICTS